MTEKLVIGVDGGGSSTTTWLAKSTGPADSIGVGVSNSSNVRRTESVASAMDNIEASIVQAFESAGRKRQTVACAVLALAGCDREKEREYFKRVALERGIAAHVQIVNDGIPLLVLADTTGPAIALVSGTGSIGVGRDASGFVHRSGGWGYLFGDEGSGFGLGVSALRAVAYAHDGRGPETELTEVVCDFFSVKSPANLIRVVYDDSLHLQTVAKLASSVIATANLGDAVAESIVESAAGEMVRLLHSLVNVSCLKNESFSLTLSGGLFVHEPSWFHQIAMAAKAAYPLIDKTILVQDPARGAVLLAQQELNQLN